MAEQKNTQPQQRGGGKKSDKKKSESAGSASRRKARKSLMYHNAGRKTRNVRRNLAKQRKQEERANRSSGRTEKGQARADRRVSVIMATGVERDLAAAEWRLKASEEPTLDQQIAGTIAEMFGGAALAQFKSEKAEATAHASA